MSNKHTTISQALSLEKIDPDDTDGFESKFHAKEELKNNIKKLAQLQEKLFASQKQAILIILQGMDTSGKDGIIKHALSGLNPQGCQVLSFKAPEPVELAHSYLWRYTTNLPMRGMVAIYNRSYYEETTTVRVHPEYLALRDLSESTELWTRRYREFNQFEHYLVHNNIKLIKIFLHISKSQQLKRLKERLDNPEKHWKFDVSDIREREHWHMYMKIYQESISATNSDFAPWQIIPANKPWYARLIFSKILIDTFESLDLSFPELNPEKRAHIERARAELNSQS